jgi:hypothetical protein
MSAAREISASEERMANIEAMRDDMAKLEAGLTADQLAPTWLAADRGAP